MVQWGAPKGKRLLGATTTKIEEPIEERYKNGWAGYWLAYFGDRKREVVGIIFESMILMANTKKNKYIEEYESKKRYFKHLFIYFSPQ